MATLEPIPPELQMRVAQWRSKADEGTISIEEMKEAVVALRHGRLAAQTAAAKSASGTPRKSKAPVDVDGLFGELGI